MTRAWPALPLLLILLSAAIAGSGIWASRLPALGPVGREAVTESAVPMDAQTEPVAFMIWTEGQLAAFASDIRDRSGFSPQRTPFSRVDQITVIVEPHYSPRLLGISGSGANASALIEWVPGETVMSVRAGDVTPWGTISFIENDEVKFLQGDAERSLVLFE